MSWEGPEREKKEKKKNTSRQEAEGRRKYGVCLYLTDQEANYGFSVIISEQDVYYVLAVDWPTLMPLERNNTNFEGSKIKLNLIG